MPHACTSHEPRPLRFAFPVVDSRAWTAGELHVSTLVRAVQDAYPGAAEILLFGMHEADLVHQYAQVVRAAGTIHYTYPRRWSVDWARNWLSRHVRGQDVSIQDALERAGVTAVFCTELGVGYGRIGTLWGLYDLQHVKMPDMFDAEERAKRDAIFRRSSQLATRIVAMSEAARRDFEAYAPALASKVRVLRPVSYVPHQVYSLDPRQVLATYGLPEKFVYLPNQFWKHKNHELVLRAVRSLKERGIDICVVLTGNMTDHRHPLHAAELFHKLSTWGLRDHVLCLGLVAREEVYLLMRQSVCVLNPSLFEGWGYSVDEARSLGKCVVLSDIPAHREQDPPRALFFDPSDPDDLAARLGEVWETGRPGPDLELEGAARQQLERRRRSYAEQFVALACEAAAAARR